ncbi:MAG: hypothetical protein US15_C0018G0001, partial [Candidatus Moranbacteria bacterium GW2011_GWF1_36_4]
MFGFLLGKDNFSFGLGELILLLILIGFFILGRSNIFKNREEMMKIHWQKMIKKGVSLILTGLIITSCNGKRGISTIKSIARCRCLSSTMVILWSMCKIFPFLPLCNIPRYPTNILFCSMSTHLFCIFLQQFSLSCIRIKHMILDGVTLVKLHSSMIVFSLMHLYIKRQVASEAIKKELAAVKKELEKAKKEQEKNNKVYEK